MNGVIGLVAVILSLGIPVASLYTYYRVRKLRTDERMAAMERGVPVPFEPEMTQMARSRRSGILLVSAGAGWLATLSSIASLSRDTDSMAAAMFALIPIAIGVGYFVDATLLRRDVRS